MSDPNLSRPYQAIFWAASLFTFGLILVWVFKRPAGGASPLDALGESYHVTEQDILDVPTIGARRTKWRPVFLGAPTSTPPEPPADPRWPDDESPPNTPNTRVDPKSVEVEWLRHVMGRARERAPRSATGRIKARLGKGFGTNGWHIIDQERPEAPRGMETITQLRISDALMRRVALGPVWREGRGAFVEIEMDVEIAVSKPTSKRLEVKNLRITPWSRERKIAWVLADWRWSMPADGKEFGKLWDGMSLLMEIEDVRNTAWSKHFRGYRAFRAKIYNPRSALAGRSAHHHMLLLGKDRAIFVGGDEEAIEILAALKLSVNDIHSAREWVETFAGLRDFQLERKKREWNHPHYKTTPEDWKLKLRKTENGRVLTCILLVDPYITFCRKYTFRIAPGGAVTAKPGDPVFMNGGYK
jgi:hypothetical protein